MNRLNEAISTLNEAISEEYEIGEWLRELRVFRRQQKRATLYSQEVYAFSDSLKPREEELERMIKRVEEIEKLLTKTR